jgi:hypothetical protein
MPPTRKEPHTSSVPKKLGRPAAKAGNHPMGDMEKVDPRTPPLLQLEVERPSSMLRPVAKAIKIVKIRF